ncbi:MAG: DUF6526 family protein [Bryobacteraceae bacterium]
MSTQNAKSHTRWDISYHFVLSLLVLALLVGSVRFFIVSLSRDGSLYPATLLLLLTLAVTVIWGLVRIYPLKAQDRAIRAEENLRHFALTGRLLSPKLTIKQIVALRFASDEELAALAAKAAAEDMPPKAIKESIRTWKPDLYRV